MHEICYNISSRYQKYITHSISRKKKQMNKIFIASLYLLIFTFTLHAKSFSMHQNSITFNAPDGFLTMSPELIQIKYPKGNPPANVLTNESTESTIAYDIRAKSLPQSQIEETGKAFESAYKRVVAGFKLNSNKIVQISGQKWIQMEFISNTIDSEVYNIFLVTGYKGKMLIFNLNTTLKEFNKYESAFRKSIQSIILK